jgi:hypothetical protein
MSLERNGATEWAVNSTPWSLGKKKTTLPYGLGELIIKGFMGRTAKPGHSNNPLKNQEA